VDSKLPDGVRELLTHRIDSFEKLEIVLALRDTTDGLWSIDKLARTLGLAPEDVRDATRELRSVSLVDGDRNGHVQLASHEHGLIEALAKAYADDRFTVIKIMGEIAMGRIRHMAAQVFADAFVIRKKPPRGGNNG
jgi:Mn-dependent DtxR family transcriptional regulator